jgi:outer membrane protein assembly factor BamB
VRRWTLPTREVVRAQPVRTAPDEIAVAGLDGEVVGVEVATGRVRWRTRVSGDVRLTPAVAAGELVVADGSGTLTGLDPQDGSPRWTAAVAAPVALGSSSTALAVVSDSTIGSYDVADHELSWRRWFPGTGQGVVVAGRDLVVVTREEVLAFSTDGTRRWARPGIDVSTDGRVVVVWQTERAEVLDTAGATLTSFAAPPETDGNPARHLVTERGVFRFDSTWTFSGWTSA